jgi:two-component system OmpR family sensor kinase
MAARCRPTCWTENLPTPLACPTLTTPFQGPYRRLQALLDKLPALVAYWDAEQRNGFANVAYVDWFGATPEWMHGRSLRELLGERLYALNLPHIEGALRGEAQHFEREVPGPHGVTRYSQADYIPDVVDGQVLGFFAMVVDITPRKALADAMERELMQARELAQALAAQARAEGESAQLRTLVAERDRMLKEREDLLRFLAHEVRQPLNNASAALQAAASAMAQPDAAPVREPLQRAEHVLQHVIGALNNNLAAATALVAGAQAQSIDTDLRALIDTVLHDVDVAHRHRVQVDTSGCSARTVQLQPGLVRLALCNLLTNALHYSPDSQPVQVRVYDSDEPLALTFEVIDRGDGLPREVLEHLFERAPRGPNSRTGGGAGLGLYLVHQIVRLHGGSVAVVPQKAKGTRMRMTFPQGVGP